MEAVLIYRIWKFSSKQAQDTWLYWTVSPQCQVPFGSVICSHHLCFHWTFIELVWLVWLRLDEITFTGWIGTCGPVTANVGCWLDRQVCHCRNGVTSHKSQSTGVDTLPRMVTRSDLFWFDFQYQLLSEIRMIIAWTIEVAHEDCTPREKSTINTSSFEAFALVNSLLRETSHDKKHESRIRAAIDVEDLVALGKILDEKERSHLSFRVEQFLSRSTDTDISKKMAFQWMSHFATYLLCSNVLPVVTRHCLMRCCSLYFSWLLPCV